MGDLIDRQAAIKSIQECADAAHDNYEWDTEEGYLNAIDCVMALPPAQSEIIRCKDCKYNPNPPECGNAACVLFYGTTDQMGFCHHGERREQE